MLFSAKTSECTASAMTRVPKDSENRWTFRVSGQINTEFSCSVRAWIPCSSVVNMYENLLIDGLCDYIFFTLTLASFCVVSCSISFLFSIFSHSLWSPSIYSHSLRPLFMLDFISFFCLLYSLLCPSVFAHSIWPPPSIFAHLIYSLFVLCSYLAKVELAASNLQHQTRWCSTSLSLLCVCVCVCVCVYADSICSVSVCVCMHNSICSVCVRVCT